MMSTFDVYVPFLRLFSVKLYLRKYVFFLKVTRVKSSFVKQILQEYTFYSVFFFQIRTKRKRIFNIYILSRECQVMGPEIDVTFFADISVLRSSEFKKVVFGIRPVVYRICSSNILSDFNHQIWQGGLISGQFFHFLMIQNSGVAAIKKQQQNTKFRFCFSVLRTPTKRHLSVRELTIKK